MKHLLLVLSIVIISNGCGYGVAGHTLRSSDRNAYYAAHPDLDPKIRDAMEWKKVIVGMNKEEVRLSLGQPFSVKVENETKERWKYNRCHHGGCTGFYYIHFENGVISSIER